MTTVATVVFIDISGSTALFETLGNERAARAVAGMTDAFKQVVVQAGAGSSKRSAMVCWPFSTAVRWPSAP
ncbi:hypothetical protein [Comamonas sp. B21-038]|uniref:hypothetical protein n=1 Tax=Comamonas sp. B21-038 TaxID=2918299 RepID=UPI001EFBCB61|nr:hypothetical protein [Comamonas sp. B21-038]ULR90734.1 hypothetical protein MJ205_07760 [Comamonas sp. B21-038]